MESDDPVLILIEWRDAYGVGTNWAPINDVTGTCLLCYSVGWLVFQDDDCVVVVPHMSQSGHPHAVQQGCGDMTIPRSAILSIKELDPKERDYAPA